MKRDMFTRILLDKRFVARVFSFAFVFWMVFVCILYPKVYAAEKKEPQSFEAQKVALEKKNAQLKRECAKRSLVHLVGCKTPSGKG